MIIYNLQTSILIYFTLSNFFGSSSLFWHFNCDAKFVKPKRYPKKAYLLIILHRYFFNSIKKRTKKIWLSFYFCVNLLHSIRFCLNKPRYQYIILMEYRFPYSARLNRKTGNISCILLLRYFRPKIFFLSNKLEVTFLKYRSSKTILIQEKTRLNLSQVATRFENRYL